MGSGGEAAGARDTMEIVKHFRESKAATLLPRKFSCSRRPKRSPDWDVRTTFLSQGKGYDVVTKYYNNTTGESTQNEPEPIPGREYYTKEIPASELDEHFNCPACGAETEPLDCFGKSDCGPSRWFSDYRNRHGQWRPSLKDEWYRELEL